MTATPSIPSELPAGDSLAAITLAGVEKRFPLFRSPWEIMAVTLGLNKWRLVPGLRREIPSYHALKNIHLDVRRGERVGIIGRNGAGKTTLLKIITGTLEPDSGTRDVYGDIEALFDAGVGFHPDLSGIENIRGALALRRNLDKQTLEDLVRNVVEFIELGDFLDQPLKKYSKGMRARLTFAVATSIRPDLVVIDEVLGAGDAYFSAKSARRMKSLLSGQCTLLLVSHSTAQVMQFCERVVWLERGEIVMDGAALSVVKAYEEFTERLRKEASERHIDQVAAQTVADSDFRREILQAALDSMAAKTAGPAQPDSPGVDGSAAKGDEVDRSRQQTLPSAREDDGPDKDGPDKEGPRAARRLIESNISASSGISRWPPAQFGIAVTSVMMRRLDDTPVGVLELGEPFRIDIEFEALITGRTDCKFVTLFFTPDGRWLSRHISDGETLDVETGEVYRRTVTFEPNYFGPGSIIFTVALFRTLGDIDVDENLETLSRSFEFKILARDSKEHSLILHPSRWSASRLVGRSSKNSGQERPEGDQEQTES